MQHIESLIVQCPNCAQCCRGIWGKRRNRPVDCCGKTVAEWGHKWIWRWTITWPQYAYLMPLFSEAPRKSQDLLLHTPRNCEAVRTHHSNTKHADYGTGMTKVDSSFRPALSVVASPTKRRAILDLAVEAENRGFSGLACPSLGGTMGLCVSLAHVTSRINYWTSIQPIYYSHPVEAANTASHINEVSDGRFRFGLGVSHGPVTQRLGVSTGKPLSDIANYVAAMRANERFGGQLPPIYLAALRNKMLQLASEISEGAIWANASLSHMAQQLSEVPNAVRPDFFLANMIPTVIDDDVEAARAVNRKTLMGYVSLPNYRNYWRGAGYVEEMDAIEAAFASGDKEKVSSLMTNKWLDDNTISGSANTVRDRLAEWADAGVIPIAVMSSTTGGQVKAINQLFEIYN